MMDTQITPEKKQPNKEEVVRRYLKSTLSKLSDIDTSNVQFDDYFDSKFLGNNVTELYTLLKIRSRTVKKNEIVDPQFDLVLKLLLENEEVVEGLVKVLGRGVSESDIQKEYLFTEYEEENSRLLRLQTVLSILDFISNTTKVPEGLKLRDMMSASQEDLNKILESLPASTKNLPPESINLIDTTYRPYIKKQIYKTKFVLDYFIPYFDLNLPVDVESNNLYSELASYNQYQEILKYKKQLSEGYVWTDSRLKIFEQIVDTLTNTSSFPILLGESGTGKTKLVEAAAKRLTGEEPVVIPCGQLSSSQRIFSGVTHLVQEGESAISYMEYGKLVQAYTGFDTSLQDDPSKNVGRIGFFDEFLLGNIKDMYAKLKVMFEKKEGDTLEGRKILPGAGMIFASNEPGLRYLSRKKPDLAIQRHLTDIHVDYFPLDELYKFMVACLINEADVLKIPLEVASPHYESNIIINVDVYYETEVLSQSFLSHGYLYRMAMAFRSVQDSFNQYNSLSYIPGTLRFTMHNDVLILQPAESSGEPLKIEKEVITPKFIQFLLEGYKSDIDVDFISYINSRLEEYLSGIELESDRIAIYKIFDYYNLLEISKPTKETVATPQDIGRMFPGVPRKILERNPRVETFSKETFKYYETEDGEVLKCTLEPILFPSVALIPYDELFVLVEPSADLDQAGDRERLKYVGKTDLGYLFQRPDESLRIINTDEVKLFFDENDISVVRHFGIDHLIKTYHLLMQINIGYSGSNKLFPTIDELISFLRDKSFPTDHNNLFILNNNPSNVSTRDMSVYSYRSAGNHVSNFNLFLEHESPEDYKFLGKI
ncbi:MAG: hypothetical protein EBV07_00340 [Proteobacteria bacterium]|nr:hypothetical protein [Pseudomonadota bacterium]